MTFDLFEYITSFEDVIDVSFAKENELKTLFQIKN